MPATKLNDQQNVICKSFLRDFVFEQHSKNKTELECPVCIEKIDYIKDYIGIISNIELSIQTNFIIDELNKSSIIYKDNKVMNQQNYKKHYQTNDKVFLVL